MTQDPPPQVFWNDHLSLHFQRHGFGLFKSSGVRLRHLSGLLKNLLKTNRQNMSRSGWRKLSMSGRRNVSDLLTAATYKNCPAAVLCTKPRPPFPCPFVTIMRRINRALSPRPSIPHFSTVPVIPYSTFSLIPVSVKKSQFACLCRRQCANTLWHPSTCQYVCLQSRKSINFIWTYYPNYFRVCTYQYLLCEYKNLLICLK